VKKLAVLAAAAAVVYLASHSGAVIGAASPVTHSANETLANSMAASGYGWTGSEATCLDELWTHESGFQMVWNTAGSGAYGIPQALPASKMATAGADYMTNPATQIKWGLGYIKDEYGTPCAAWHFETSHSPNWY
jgi:hypothetical protein